MKLTILVCEEDGWFIGQLAEYPGAIDQARSLEELKVRLLEAFYLLLDTQKDLTLTDYQQEGEKFTLENLYVTGETKRLVKAFRRGLA